MKDQHFLIPSIVLAAGLIIAVAIFTWNWKDTKDADQTITVTGSAKQDIIADLGVLRGSIGVEALTPGGAYQALTAQKPALLEYLNSQGFSADRVTFFPISSDAVYDYNTDGQQSRLRGYACTQRMEIQSGDVQLIRRISLDITGLVEKGVFFHVEAPEYYYTKLAGVKIRIQSEAAKDASVRAERIVAATGRSLGPLRSARMGVLQITPKNSNQVSDYGVNDVSSIEKEITAVVNASFQIR